MKVLAWIAGLVLVAAGAVVYLVATGDFLKRAVETAGSEALGTTVAIDELNLSFAEGSGEILGLQIGNPPGYEGVHSMRFGQIKLVLDGEQISERLIVVKQVIVDGADVSAVVKGKQSNLEALLDNVDSAEEAPTGAPEPKIIIDRFDFTNAHASITSDVAGDVSLDIPDVHLTGIGRKSDGVTAAEAAQQLLRPVVQAVSREMIAKGIGVDVDELADQAEQRLRDKVDEEVGDGLKSIAERFGHPD